MKQLLPIHESLPMLAGWYAGKFGVPIKMDSKIMTEHTDGKSVSVPFINLHKLKEAGKTASEINAVKNAIFGWTAHGCMHVRFTDFDYVKGLPALTDTKFSLINTIEDCRIERECLKLFPGTRETLNGLAEYMLSQGLYDADVSGNANPIHVFLDFALFYLQANFMDQKFLAPLANKLEAKMIELFGLAFVIRYKALLGQVVHLKSTKEVVDLTFDIFKWLEEEAKKASNQAPGCSDSNSSNDDDSSDSTDSSGDQDQTGPAGDDAGSSGDDAGSDSGNASAQPGSDSNVQDQPTDSETGKASAEPDSSDQKGDMQDQNGTGKSTINPSSDNDADKAKNLQELLNNGGCGYQDPSDKLANLFDQMVEQTKDSSMDFKYYSEAKKANKYYGSVAPNSVADAKSASSRIRQKMLGLVQANQRKDTLLTRSGKRFDAARLHSVVNGNTRIFTKEIEHRMPNTSVQLLVDLSSSMQYLSHGGKKKSTVAQEAALALALALKPIAGVKCNVTYFRGDDQNPLIDVLESNQSVNLVANNFFSTSEKGGTPLTEGLWFSANRLLKQKEDKKILFVITDGEPSNDVSTRHVMKLIYQTDIRVVAIGIKTNAVNRFFKEAVVIQDINDLQNSLFESMRQSLLS